MRGFSQLPARAEPVGWAPQGSRAPHQAVEECVGSPSTGGPRPTGHSHWSAPGKGGTGSCCQGYLGCARHHARVPGRCRNERLGIGWGKRASLNQVPPTSGSNSPRAKSSRAIFMFLASSFL